jgi:hypothetical protein
MGAKAFPKKWRRRGRQTFGLYLQIYKVALYTNSEAGVKDIVNG